MGIRNINTAGIIHIFALLHAAVALSCRMAGVDDSLLLTVLTMAMALLVCMKKRLSVEFTAASIIVVNIIGYLMGTFGANLLGMLMNSDYAIHAISTALTTEILGWSIVAITKLFKPAQSSSDGSGFSSNFKWVLFAAGGIFVLRICIIYIFSLDQFEAESLIGITGLVLSNSVALSVLICVNILYVRLAVRWIKPLAKWKTLLVFIAFMLAATLLETGLVGLGLPFGIKPQLTEDFAPLFVVSLMTQITVYCIVYMINSAITARAQMQAERGKANMAQYRYMKLKQQVNPHFLFNSLNILDCLVCEEKTEQASTYIHKLAGIYRYMLKSEDEDVVQLRDELTFTELYIDLLKVRFPEGLKVETHVPEELMARFVLPCSLQLLIENATKHNAVSPEEPLVITVTAEGDSVKVSNNLLPKVTKSPSTGLGQKYLMQQYLDISGRSIQIEKTANRYCVTLPLL